MARLRRLAAAAAVCVLSALPVAAQEQPAPGRPSFLVLNQERILTDSQLGRALLAEEEAARDRLRREARDIDRAFEAEEQRLTDLRPTLPPEEFRALADEFDARVVAARREQDARSAALAQEFDRRRRRFYAEAAPVLVSLMARYGALAILDENSVLLADQTLDITEAVIAEIDAAGAGEAPADPAPAAPPGAGAPAGDAD